MLYIVGLVRNAEKTIASDIRRLDAATQRFQNKQWFLVESDSDDGTLQALGSLRDEITGFSFQSLGNLRQELPDRVDRIAYCRNAYLDWVTTRASLGSNDWVLIADLDGINTLVDEFGVTAALNSGDADAYFANQLGPYYDIFALRAPNWCETDVFHEMHKLTAQGVQGLKAYRAAVQSKMITIPRTAEPIEVDSAFGGLAFYRASIIGDARYASRDELGQAVCEHVVFNHAIKERGARLVVFPQLINAKYTDHTTHLKPMMRIFGALGVGIFGPKLAARAYLLLRRYW